MSVYINKNTGLSVTYEAPFRMWKEADQASRVYVYRSDDAEKIAPGDTIEVPFPAISFTGESAFLNEYVDIIPVIPNEFTGVFGQNCVTLTNVSDIYITDQLILSFFFVFKQDKEVPSITPNGLIIQQVDGVHRTKLPIGSGTPVTTISTVNIIQLIAINKMAEIAAPSAAYMTTTKIHPLLINMAANVSAAETMAKPYLDDAEKYPHIAKTIELYRNIYHSAVKIHAKRIDDTFVVGPAVTSFKKRYRLLSAIRPWNNGTLMRHLSAVFEKDGVPLDDAMKPYMNEITLSNDEICDIVKKTLNGFTIGGDVAPIVSLVRNIAKVFVGHDASVFPENDAVTSTNDDDGKIQLKITLVNGADAENDPLYHVILILGPDSIEDVSVGGNVPDTVTFAERGAVRNMVVDMVNKMSQL